MRHKGKTLDKLTDEARETSRPLPTGRQVREVVGEEEVELAAEGADGRPDVQLVVGEEQEPLTR